MNSFVQAHSFKAPGLYTCNDFLRSADQ